MFSTSLLLSWLAFASPAPVESPPPSTSVYSLEDEAFVNQARRDLEVLERDAQGLLALRAQLDRTRALYLRPKDEPYSPDDKRVLLTTWAAFSDHFQSLERVRQRYWDFVKEPALTRGAKHTWGFLLTHGALAAELAHGLAYAELTTGRAQLEVLLDEIGRAHV